MTQIATNLAMGFHHDYETGSTLDLRKSGPWVYGEGWSTHVKCMAYCLADGPIKLWWPGMPCPEEYIFAANNGLPFIAHNAGFERAISTTIMAPKFGWPVPPLPQWICTAAMAAAMALPRGLDDATQVMGVNERKDKKGHALMLRMARPRSKTPIRCHVCGLMQCDHHEMFKTSLVWWNDADRMLRLGEYCMQDVRTERALCHVLRPLTEFQRKVWLLNETMNERGIQVDMTFVKQAAAMVTEITADLNKELAELTNDSSKLPIRPIVYASGSPAMACQWRAYARTRWQQCSPKTSSPTCARSSRSGKRAPRARPPSSTR